MANCTVYFVRGQGTLFCTFLYLNFADPWYAITVNNPNQVCDRGFVYINDTCLDYDECKEESSRLRQGLTICAHDAICSNNIGGFSCICKFGFKVDTDVIDVNDTKKTNGNSTQVNVATQCVDIDECSRQSVCPKSAQCQNTEGSYICNCFDGFEGEYCTDIDECNSTAICDVNAECLNINGGYKCTCKDGYYGTGDSCFSGQCPDANCPINQKCVSATTIDCECEPGFQFNNSSDCVDIDECEAGFGMTKRFLLPLSCLVTFVIVTF